MCNHLVQKLRKYTVHETHNPRNTKYKVQETHTPRNTRYTVQETHTPRNTTSPKPLYVGSVLQGLVITLLN